MKITVLAEDTAACAGVIAEHGLALLVETDDATVLCDGGQTAALLSNAAVLGKDLSAVTVALLSHGHYDHAGGLVALAKNYPHIPIVLRKEADGGFYHGEREIGIEKSLIRLPQARVVTSVGITAVARGVSVFGGFGRAFARPVANEGLTVRDAGGVRADDFCHEQAAVIEENGRRVLVSGCAHSGVLNILARFTQLYGGQPDAVVSGFHTMKSAPVSPAERAQMRALAAKLRQSGAMIYSGHCTGDAAFSEMKPLLGERLVRFRCGDEFEV